MTWDRLGRFLFKTPRAFVFGEFNLEVQRRKQIRAAVVPRSGYVSKPRVASTLGKPEHILLNPERVAPV
jgi:hypothetical protein